MSTSQRNRETNATESLFPKPTYYKGEKIRFEHLPYLARIAVERIHDLRPDVVIAGDRGARLPAVAIYSSWHHRYPNEPFPTRGGKIQMARVSNRGATLPNVIVSVHRALGRAGIPRFRDDEMRGDNTPRTLYIDDWVCDGGTLDRFIEAIEKYGLPKRSVTYLTLCGERVDGIDHIVCDPKRYTFDADWNDDCYAAGVDYYFDSMEPMVKRSARARIREVRDTIADSIAEYYERYEAALAAGKIAACACVQQADVVT